VELEHKAYWLLIELEEIRNDAYENSKSFMTTKY
jgi:hypothetical protein